MAKVNFGTIANDARGKINGTVYSKNKSGSYVRRKVTPANPSSPAQSAVRSNFQVLSQNWSGLLSAADRAAWLAYANTYPRLDVFGNAIKISGLNAYLSLNTTLLNAGKPIITIPPATNVITPIAFDPTSFVVNVGGALCQFDQTAAGAANLYFYLFGSRPLPPGRTVQKNDWRFMAAQPSNIAGPFPFTNVEWALYLSKFGAPLAGQNISILVATLDTDTGLTTVGTTLTTLAT